jgi:hypothetical protein
MYILLINNEQELRIVKGDTVSRLQPMFDLGFYPEGSLEHGDIPIEESLALIESQSLESLVQRLVDPSDIFETFKRIENVVKQIFEPIEVKRLYLEQKSYKKMDAFDVDLEEYF